MRNYHHRLWYVERAEFHHPMFREHKSSDVLAMALKDGEAGFLQVRNRFVARELGLGCGGGLHLLVTA